ncbi:MAG: hypothetical protein A2Z47_13070 [Thermodesulfovibrio sp. RBG_19FT_COMBO_42_12]|nr:MAG: hypothetical protein A2Z47_13070 [Thermodesulfovibrio sp. RBG_19FT_COMBO_42_12]
MEGRTGEKIGWSAGWIGGFIWVSILSIVFLFQEKYEQGLLGMALTGVAIATIVFFAPWRFPSTPYWKLMLAPYGMFFLSIAWAIWSYGGLGSVGLAWWNFLWLLPLLIPFGILSKRKWTNSVAQSAPRGWEGMRVSREPFIRLKEQPAE